MDPLLAIGFWAYVLTVAGIYAIFVLGLQIQVGATGLLNFGHVASMAIGAENSAWPLRAARDSW